MGIFSKLKQLKQADPEAMRFAMTYDLVKSGYNGTIAALVARTLMPMMQDPFNRNFEDQIRSAASEFASMIGIIRKRVPAEFNIAGAEIFMLKYVLTAVNRYINLAEIFKTTHYSGYAEWLEIKQVVEKLNSNH